MELSYIRHSFLNFTADEIITYLQFKHNGEFDSLVVCNIITFFWVLFFVGKQISYLALVAPEYYEALE